MPFRLHCLLRLPSCRYLFVVIVGLSAGFSPGLAAAEVKATAPSQAEWAPVQQALDNQATDAQAKLTALLRTYPTWADGNKALARLLIEQGKPAEALAAAKRTTSIAPDDIEALRIQVRALTELKRPAEIATLMGAAAAKDSKGWLHYEAGLAAVSAGDSTKAESYLNAAKTRGGAKVPAEFLFLDSRIAILAKDYPRAELALSSATTQQPDFWDGWYELGRVRLVLVDSAPLGQRSAWIKKATEAFSAVAKNVPTDPNAHTGLGRAALEQAKVLVAQDNNDQASASLREAVGHLNHALALNPQLAEAYVLLGDAQIRLEQWEAAATALQQAQKCGATERSLTFNLAIALQQTGENAAAETLLKSITAAGPAEQITLGMGAYRSRNWLLATNLLTAAVSSLEDQAARASTWRIIGHTHSKLAQVKNLAPDDVERERDTASAAYKQAGDLVDFPARRFYLAAEAARSPERAYTAAWDMIAWDALNPGAWALVLGNYGAAKTGGQGIGGMASRAPVHLAAWGLLVLIPMGLFGWGLVKRKPPSSPDNRRGPPKPTRPPGSKPAEKTSAPDAAPSRSSRPARPQIRAKTATEPTGPIRQRTDQKAETMMIPAPPIKAGIAGKHTVKPIIRHPSQVLASEAPEQSMFPTPSPEAGAGALERRKK